MNVSGFVAFCDDIRFENTGKAILIGLYVEDLIPTHLPQVVPMSFWVRLNGLPVGETAVTMKIGSNDKVQHKADLTMAVHHPERPTNLYFVGPQISLDQPGEIFLELSGFPDGSHFKETLIVRSPSESGAAAPVDAKAQRS